LLALGRAGFERLVQSRAAKAEYPSTERVTRAIEPEDEDLAHELAVRDPRAVPGAVLGT